MTTSRPYDDLGAEQQAVVRADWLERVRAARNNLDLAAIFAAEGRSYVELDDDGRVIERSPGADSSRG